MVACVAKLTALLVGRIPTSSHVQVDGTLPICMGGKIPEKFFPKMKVDLEGAETVTIEAGKKVTPNGLIAHKHGAPSLSFPGFFFFLSPAFHPGGGGGGGV